MDKSKKIMAAVIGVLVVVCAVAVGLLIGSNLDRAKQTEEPVVTEAYVPEETVPAETEAIPDMVFPEETEPVYAPPVEPETYPTAAPTTQAPTTKAPTTKAPTTKAPTTKAPTTKAPTTAATTAKVTTTAAPTTTTTTSRSAYVLLVYSDGGATDVSGGGRYAPGELVKVSMTPALGSTFQRWESSDKKVLADSTSQTYVFQMPASNVSLRAVTYTRPLLTVNKGTGIASVTGGQYYSPGEKVTVTAQLVAGYKFAGWTSSPAGLSSTSTTYSFTMPNYSVTLTASAKADAYTLRVISGTGVRSVSGDGKYKPGEKVTLRIVMQDGYTFNRWGGLNASYNGEYISFTMPAEDLTLTASGTPTSKKYTVRINVGLGIRSVSGDGSYYPGDKVTLRAYVQDGYTFNRWEGLSSGAGNSAVTFTMPSNDVTVTATATEEKRYFVTLDRGEGIYSCTGGGSFTAGSTVTITCVVNTGYTFSGWKSSDTGLVRNGYTQTYTFTMPRGNVNLTATAEKEKKQLYTVTVRQGTGISDAWGGGTFAPGETVTVECVVKDGFVFYQWDASGAGYVADSTRQRYTFVMPDGNVTMTATAFPIAGDQEEPNEDYYYGF